MRTYSQADLVSDLIGIFPEFASCWEDNVDEESRSSNLHSVYISFLPFLGRIQPTQRQWQLLADHLSKAVASGGEQGNAADTCVLEHLHQVGLNRVIRPLLSRQAQSCVRA
jgi:hypothetical protein